MYLGYIIKNGGLCIILQLKTENENFQSKQDPLCCKDPSNGCACFHMGICDINIVQ